MGQGRGAFIKLRRPPGEGEAAREELVGAKVMAQRGLGAITVLGKLRG